MTRGRVLVVGAGIAGTTAAYWLGRYGLDPTVVEWAGAQRSSGNPVDVRGPALAVVDQMGLLGPLHEAATRVTNLTLVDGQGRRIGWIPTQADAGALEIPRGELAAILAGAGREHAEFILGDTVVALHDDGDGVDVVFERAAPRRFDLVVGADGLHSRVRRLVFGPEPRFVTDLGMSVAGLTLDRAPADPGTVYLHTAPGRALAVHPGTGREIAAFIFRRPPPRAGEQGVTDPKQHLAAAYAEMRWRAPELLERVRDSDDLYFDAVSRVRLDHWSRSRVVLVGDAATCVSLFGEGSSMAVAGARTLADEVAASPDDPAAALVRYEQLHRRRVQRRQRGVAMTAHLLVPATRAGTAARNAVFRLWPRIDAARPPDHRPPSP